MPQARGAENEQDAQCIAGKLREENEYLHRWIDHDEDRLVVVCERAARVRESAHDLVDSASRQGAARQSQEEALYLSQERVHSELDGLRAAEAPDWEYLKFGARSPWLTGEGWGRDGHHSEPGWKRWVEQSEYWEQIEDEAEQLIIDAHEQYDRRKKALAAAERVVRSMDQTVGDALARSASCFRDGEPGRRPARASAAPFVAFLLVALAGISIAPKPIVGWIAFAVLLVVVALSVRSAVGDDYRAISVAALAAGSSLAFFSAAYLAVRIAQPDDLLRSGVPISSIAEASFTSLTVGVTGGTIGIDLGGAARVVAFVQILLTVGAVASGITWGWRRLVDGLDGRGARPRG
ncbi:MAG: hypothetical protein WBQ21_03280 [Solirubrobacteraceae bacterium]